MQLITCIFSLMMLAKQNLNFNSFSAKLMVRKSQPRRIYLVCSVCIHNHVRYAIDSQFYPACKFSHIMWVYVCNYLGASWKYVVLCVLHNIHACDHMSMHVFWLEQQVQIVNFLKSASSLEAPFGCNRQCTFVFSPLKSTATHFYLIVIHSLAFNNMMRERWVELRTRPLNYTQDYTLCQHISL